MLYNITPGCVPFTFQSIQMAFLSLTHCKIWRNYPGTQQLTQMSITPSCLPDIPQPANRVWDYLQTLWIPSSYCPGISCCHSSVSELHVLGHDMSLLEPTGYLPCVLKASPTSYSLSGYLQPQFGQDCPTFQVQICIRGYTCITFLLVSIQEKF